MDPGRLRPSVPVWGSQECSGSPETTDRLGSAAACRWETGAGRVSVRHSGERTVMPPAGGSAAYKAYLTEE